MGFEIGTNRAAHRRHLFATDILAALVCLCTVSAIALLDNPARQRLRSDAAPQVLSLGSAIAHGLPWSPRAPSLLCPSGMMSGYGTWSNYEAMRLSREWIGWPRDLPIDASVRVVPAPVRWDFAAGNLAFSALITAIIAAAIHAGRSPLRLTAGGLLGIAAVVQVGAAAVHFLALAAFETLPSIWTTAFMQSGFRAPIQVGAGYLGTVLTVLVLHLAYACMAIRCVLVRLPARYVRLQREAPGNMQVPTLADRCWRCGYPVGSGSTCSECGSSLSSFDWANRRQSGWASSPWARVTMWLLLSLCVMAASLPLWAGLVRTIFV